MNICSLRDPRASQRVAEVFHLHMEAHQEQYMRMQEIYVSLEASRQAAGPTEPPIPRVLLVLTLWLKRPKSEVGH